MRFGPIGHLAPHPRIEVDPDPWLYLTYVSLLNIIYIKSPFQDEFRPDSRERGVVVRNFRIVSLNLPASSVCPETKIATMMATRGSASPEGQSKTRYRLQLQRLERRRWKPLEREVHSRRLGVESTGVRCSLRRNREQVDPTEGGCQQEKKSRREYITWVDPQYREISQSSH